MRQWEGPCKVLCARQAAGRSHSARHPRDAGHPGGHDILRPPNTCRCTWRTTWFASRPVLITARQPVLSRPCSRATCAARAKTGAITVPSPTSSSEARWRFGITRMCTGISGLMSGNAMAPAFSPSFFAGILPATILQKMQSSMKASAGSERFPGVEQQGYGAFVHDPDLHGGAEDAFRHLHSALARQLTEPRIERLSNLRPRGIDESGPGSLARIPEQRELRDRQDPSVHVEHGPVHLSLLILEDPQADDLVRHPPRVLLGIPLPDPHQDTKTLGDRASHLAANRHRRFTDPLHHRPHEAPISKTNLDRKSVV